MDASQTSNPLSPSTASTFCRSVGQCTIAPSLREGNGRVPEGVAGVLPRPATAGEESRAGVLVGSRLARLEAVEGGVPDFEPLADVVSELSFFLLVIGT